MTDLGDTPAQRYFVKRFIDWNLVESRCEHYPAIGKAFPLARLKKGSKSPPYYCHDWKSVAGSDSCHASDQELPENPLTTESYSGDKLP